MNTKSTGPYLVACMVAGIVVEHNTIDMMDGLVYHMNHLDRPYYATGDIDGVIIHDESDSPTLLVRYDGTLMRFSAFDWEGEQSADAGYMMINIISYLQTLDIDFAPAINMQEPEEIQQTQDDWSL